MSENTSENLPPKKPGALKKIPEIARRVREKIDDFIWGNPSMPTVNKFGYKQEPIAKARRPIGIRVLPQDEEVLQPVASEQEVSTLPDLEHNIQASEQFIESLRSPSRYRQDPNDLRFMKSSLGYRVENPSETGWFDLHSVLTVARERYKLPVAIYVGADHHARLLIKGYSDTPGGKKITVYNPFNSGFEEIDVKFDVNGHTIGVLKNTSDKPLQREEFNLMKVLESPELAKYRNLLTNIKAFGFQKDLRNCIPYCLFASAMLHGLEPGNTEFKRQGIKQFEQDFGVRIMTREEILPKLRVRLV